MATPDIQDQSVPAPSTDRWKPLLYLEPTLGPANVTRGIGSLDTFTFNDYVRTNMALGLEWEHKPWVLFGVGVGYDHISGNQNVYGSSRHQGFVQLGLRFRFAKILFAGARAGVGFNDVAFNFGGGVTPRSVFNFSIIMTGEAGAEWCFAGNRSCLGLVAKAHYEMGVTGGDPYSILDVTVGPVLRVNFGAIVPTKDHQRAVNGFEDANREIARLRKKVSNAEEVISQREAAIGSLEGDLKRFSKTNKRLGDENSDLRVAFDAEQRAKGGLTRTVELLVVELEKPTILRNPLKEVIPFPNEAAVLGLVKETSSGKIIGYHHPVLDVIVAYLKAHLGTRIKIHGYANTTGKPEFNTKVSLQRAEEVRDYLLQSGIKPDQIVSTEGHGAEKPIDKDPAGSLNRRVEFEEVKP